MPSAPEGPERLNVDVDIGGGLNATAVQLSDGPIVLVDLRAGRVAAVQRSRLDLHKHMFIDPLPGQRDTDAVRRLALQAMDQLERTMVSASAARQGRASAGGGLR